MADSASSHAPVAKAGGQSEPVPEHAAPSSGAAAIVPPGQSAAATAGSITQSKTATEPHPAQTGIARSGAVTQGSDSSETRKSEGEGLSPDQATLRLAASGSPDPTPSTAPQDSDAEDPGARPPAGPRIGRAHRASADGPFPPGAADAHPGLALAVAHDAETRPDQPASAGLDQAGLSIAPSQARTEAGRDPAAAAQASAQSPASAAGTAPATPQAAAQLGHALAAIHTAADGSSQLRILLNPAELGSVQVSITRAHDGASSVSVAVERPETLQALQTDLTHLHQALDRAGLPERSVTLHLAAADPPQGALTGGQTGSGGNGTAWSGSQQGQQGSPHARLFGQAMSNGAEIGQLDPEPAWTPAAWQRASVDFTA